MNIFYLSTCPADVAEWAIDSHVNKMAIESAQMLTAAHSPIRTDGFGYPFPKSVFSHPCTQWVRKSGIHYAWLHSLMCCYCHEYEYRYGKTHYIVRKGINKQLARMPADLSLDVWNEPPAVMPDDYKSFDKDGSVNTIDSYRRYYTIAKKSDRRGRIMHRWTSRQKPGWMKDYEHA
jgi:hypothetical protein